LHQAGGITSVDVVKGMPLEYLNLTGLKVADLSAIRNMTSMRDLVLTRTPLADLAVVKDLNLRSLCVEGTKLSDLSALQRMNLVELRLTPKNISKGLEVIRDMKSLKTIGLMTNQVWPAAEFWERYDQGEFGAGPFTDAKVQRIAALPAAEQVEEVRKELKRRNPGFDGKVQHKVEGDVVTEFLIMTDQVRDIDPIRVFNSLRVLALGAGRRSQLADLTPLKGMNLAGLKDLTLQNTSVTDAGLAPFKDCKNLTRLHLMNTPISDVGLAHFKDCKDLRMLFLGGTQVTDAGLVYFKECRNLGSLGLGNTKVTDAGLVHFKDCKFLGELTVQNTRVTNAGLAHFKGMQLRNLHMNDTAISDLTPLQGMPLRIICFTPKNITKGLDDLRDMKSLIRIGIDEFQSWPAAEFWERYDRGEFKD
jgi:Leucine-rich repeat (LRR) protein